MPKDSHDRYNRSEDIMAVIRRHWTNHALQRLCEQYNLDDYEPEIPVDLVERIERKYRAAFANSY
jgi:hypothetical protein